MQVHRHIQPYLLGRFPERLTGFLPWKSVQTPYHWAESFVAHNVLAAGGLSVNTLIDGPFRTKFEVADDLLGVWRLRCIDRRLVHRALLPDQRCRAARRVEHPRQRQPTHSRRGSSDS